MIFADEKKRRSLDVLYRAMPTGELKRRLRAGGLAAAAQQAAEAELQRRSSPGAADIEPIPAPDDDGGRAGLVRAVVGVVATGAFALLVSPEMAAFVPVLVLPWVLAPVAKAFPRMGLVVGILLALLPLVLLAWGWMSGQLAWQSGDFKPLGTLLAWGVLIFAFLVCWSLASMLIWGARHRGSWRRMHRRLHKMREEQLDALK